ncbi:hypothetical protein, partial [Escherichia coli]|uniref:hypothetical protein n=1 Tax=Escherichia coli TaxID=562 RepID=UPI0022649153
RTNTATEMLILYVMLILFQEHSVDMDNFQISGSPYFARARLYASDCGGYQGHGVGRLQGID